VTAGVRGTPLRTCPLLSWHRIHVDVVGLQLGNGDNAGTTIEEILLTPSVPACPSIVKAASY